MSSVINLNTSINKFFLKPVIFSIMLTLNKLNRYIGTKSSELKLNF